MTGDRPQVSVVIPAHQRERYVAEAARSAVAQDGVRVEVLVVDDGSTDGTAAAAQAVPGVRVVRQSNSGVAAARNAGCRATTGEVLCFLDADDRLRPGGLARGLARLGGGDFCFGRSQLVDADGGPLPTQVHPPVPAQALYRELLRDTWVVPAGAMLVRRNALEAIGGFPEDMREGGEDLEVYLELARRCRGTDHTDLVCDYRLHPGNMSKGYRSLLEQNVRVLQRHAPHTAADPELERARRAGIAQFERVYGTKAALADAAGALRQRQGVGRAGARAVTAVLRHPVYAGRLVTTAVRRGRSIR